jgi:spore protease
LQWVFCFPSKKIFFGEIYKKRRKKCTECTKIRAVNGKMGHTTGERTGDTVKNEKFCRTDLAVEWPRAEKETLPRGVFYESEKRAGFSVHTLKISSPEGALALGKEQGQYRTYEIGRPWNFSDETLERAVSLLAEGLRELAFGEKGGARDACTKDACPIDLSAGASFFEQAAADGGAEGAAHREARKDEADQKDEAARRSAVAEEQAPEKEEDCILVVGLGNRAMTADAIGPMVVDRITVTRHVKRLDPPLFRRLAHRSVAAFCPGVLGQTGMESADGVKAVAGTLRPRLLLVIDALAARSPDRLAATVQLSTGGIAPGSGVGNNRPAFTRDSMGLPVIAIGVPMVVDSSTLVSDALEKAGISDLPPALLPVLENGRSFFVSLKEADAATESMATLLASAIDSAMSV